MITNCKACKDDKLTNDILHAAAHRYHLTESQGKEIEEELKTWSSYLHARSAHEKGSRVWELAKLFE